MELRAAILHVSLPLTFQISCSGWAALAVFSRQRLGFMSWLERVFHGVLSRQQESTYPSLSSCVSYWLQGTWFN